MDKKNIEDILLFTPLQEGMLFHYLKAPRADYYIEQLELTISGTIDVKHVEKAWNLVIETNEILRTLLRWEKVKEPIQLILKEYPFQVEYHDIAGENAGEQKRYLEEIKAKERKKAANLRENVPFRVTLCKTGEYRYKMVISNHHMMYDGWSTGIILNEFFAAYNELSLGKNWIKPVKTKFKEFIKWCRSRETHHQEKFWREYLRGFNTPTKMIYHHQKPKEIPIMATVPVTFGQKLKRELHGFIRKRRATLAAVLYCAWGLLLQKYTGCDDVVFGTTVSGRSAKVRGIENMVGLFINTLPLRVQSQGRERIDLLLERIDTGLKIREPYETTSLVDLKEYSEIDNREELFDTIVVLENYPLAIKSLSGTGPLAIEAYAMTETTHYDLTVTIIAAGDMDVRFTFDKNTFAGEALVRLSGHFKRVVEAILTESAREIAAVEIITAEEKRRLLFDFNDTVMPYPNDKGLHQLFEEQAGTVPDRIAVTAPGQGALAYGELQEKSNQLAGLLREKGVLPDTLVGIMVEPSLELLVGIMAILKAGGAYLPIDPGYPAERIRCLLADSGTTILLSPVSEVRGWNGEILHSPKQQDILKPAAANAQTAASLAYVIYTSGSTGTPKGVPVQHRSAVNILVALHRDYPLTASGTVLLKTSYCFDVSITELFGWFLGGGRLAIMGPGTQGDPLKIVDAIRDHRVTHVNFVPSMFNAFVDVLHRQGAQAAYRPRSLAYIFLAGEALPPRLVKRFHGLGTGIRLENLYGPTEAAIYASRYSLSRWNGKEPLPIGSPLPNIRCYILGRSLEIQPLGVPGELSIAGDGLARGYLNNPELTSEKFVSFFDNRSYRSYRSYISKKLYKTGDLARWLPDGNIDFLGRIDNQVKIRGFRIELGEIETRLNLHPEIKEAVVTLKEDKTGDPFLCAYIVPYPGESFEPRHWRRYLREKLPDYMVPAYFVRLAALPLLSSGKVDRQSLPGPEISPRREFIPPRNAAENRLAEIWSPLLGIKKANISIDDHFFELGGHSLKAVRMISRIHSVFNIELPLALLFDFPRLGGLAGILQEKAREGGHGFRSLMPAEEKEYYPLSPAQKRLYILQQRRKDSTGYNMPLVLSLEGTVHRELLESALKKLIARHESLRTSFHLVKGETVQWVHEPREIEFAVEFPGQGRREDKNLEPLIADFIRPFDLSRSPLLRAALIKREASAYLFMVDLHHIIADGVTQKILLEDFISLYQGRTLPLPRLQYTDYVVWQYREKKSSLQQQETYWLKMLAGGVQVLKMPHDFPRPPEHRFEGDTIEFAIDPARTAALKDLAASEDATLYMILLALYNVLLSKITGQEEIVVGTVVAGRNHTDLEPLAGMFVNTLILRNFPRLDQPFRDFCGEVKKNTLEALENRDYPLEELAERLGTAREQGNKLPFDVLFSLQNIGAKPVEFLEKIPGLKVHPYPYKNKISKFDLMLEGEERDRQLYLIFEYSTNLFKGTTIRRFIKYFNELVTVVVQHPDQPLGEIAMIRHQEFAELIKKVRRKTETQPLLADPPAKIKIEADFDY